MTESKMRALVTYLEKHGLSRDAAWLKVRLMTPEQRSSYWGMLLHSKSPKRNAVWHRNNRKACAELGICQVAGCRKQTRWSYCQEHKVRRAA
jgi:hypothetical protein